MADAELNRAVAAAIRVLHPDPPPRTTPYDRPWTRKAEADGAEVLAGAEIPLPDDRRLKMVPFSDKVRSHFSHGGTLDTLVMPFGDVERFVVQTDPTKDVVRSVTLPKGARVVRAPQLPGEESDGRGAADAVSPRQQPAARGKRGLGRSRRDGADPAPPPGLTDSRTQRVLMFYELQSSLRSVETRAPLTGIAAKLSRKLARRMDEVGSAAVAAARLRGYSPSPPPLLIAHAG